MSKKYTNSLINESSPYLLQHAHNPVDWRPWNAETLALAKKENKPLLISIGYSACHWCHVMEHESFENEKIASIMNKYFICIKVDREERPDVDQIYMDAVHLMKGQGGWPLNCFALPDGKPFFGGTYFRPNQWVDVLYQMHELYTNQNDNVKKYADRLTLGIKQSGVVILNKEEKEFSQEEIDLYFQGFKTAFDMQEGGSKGAPKFPMPNQLSTLLYAYQQNQDAEILQYLKLSADKMAMGGIYDQIGGGFARYSVDAEWKVPHFEKMLYDNAQLVSFYADLYKLTKNSNYLNIIDESLTFVERELSDDSGAFYSALDADSDGEEGKFYVWKENEFKETCAHYAPLMADYYRIGKEAYWENGNNIPLIKESKDDFSQRNNLSTTELESLLKLIKEKLLEKRSTRVRPGLDDKTLCSWNALMIKGYVDAYTATSNSKYLDRAIKNAVFIKDEMYVNKELYHTWKKGKATIPGFMEDYAFLIEALLALYSASMDMQWLKWAEQLTDEAISRFYSKTNVTFYFSSKSHDGLLVRKPEIMDNVIPASNSSMANSLFILGTINHNQEYLAIAKQMLKNIKESMIKYGAAFSNWARLALHLSQDFKVKVLIGKEVNKYLNEELRIYEPNSFVMAATKEEEHPYLENRFVEGKVLKYVCRDGLCESPEVLSK